MVLPSLWAENSPIIIREAITAGMKIICSTQGGAKEIAPNAVLIPNGDTQQLRKAMSSMIPMNLSTHKKTFPSMNEHINKLLQIYKMQRS